MTVTLIWAQAANGVIGAHGALPWDLPEDRKHFRALTVDGTVLMGRATWDSLPEPFRPLPRRRNVVLTRQSGWSAPGAIPVTSLPEALAEHTGDLWVIGGAEVYRAAMPYADRLIVTELADTFDGNVYAPDLEPTWRVVGHEPDVGWHVSRTGLRYRIVTYETDAPIS
ncbi:dihydrofolate reductase [Pseudonocardia spinosispora]|uniref:dihydrofolate reductase n=1 Tax=Pseudonocardia spinosispora TaxID=103441 RepID=UPI000409F618|nr:dihydrofolate reductase [Pseudonocardia spinosispora]